jgi:hypothetical protein
MLTLRLPTRCLAPALAAALAWGAWAATRAADAPITGPALEHSVFFTLKDHSKEARDRLVASCEKYLRGHEGATSVAIGTIAEDVREPVSDRDFDVALHVVFRDKAAAATYQSHPRHRQFIAENKDTWARVRVFDSYLTAP